MAWDAQVVPSLTSGMKRGTADPILVLSPLMEDI